MPAPVIVEQKLQASRQAVWDALTNVHKMRQWYFENIESFEPKVGFETEFTVEANGKTFPHQWKVTEVVPQQKLSYNWKYEGYPGNSYVTFKISEKDGGTHLKLTHQETEPFPKDIPEFRRDSCLEGWKYFIQSRLKEFLKGSVHE